jgi:hypothetical protein
VGEFLVYHHNEPILIDPGVGEYTSQTFSGGRYGIWTMQSGYHNLPQINGTDQRDGKQFAAKVVAQKAGKLTLDIAGAYPEEAAVKSWKRTVTVDRKGMSVTEDYELTAQKAPTRLMLLTLAKPSLVKAGRIGLGPCELTYAPSQLEAQVEDISDRLDPLLREMWGPHMYRLVLTVKSQAAKGSITYQLR